MIVAFDPATPAGDEQSLTVVDGSTGDIVIEPSPPSDPTAATGEPVAAELSSDGTFLAMRQPRGALRDGPGAGHPRERGRCRRRRMRAPSRRRPRPPTIGETTALGTSVAGSPFLERLAWSSDSRWLAYTLADPNGGGTDAWVYDTATNEFWQLTDVGDAYAASWVEVPESDVPALWVSRAEGTVTSYLTAVMTDDGRAGRAASIRRRIRSRAPSTSSSPSSARTARSRSTGTAK